MSQTIVPAAPTGGPAPDSLTGPGGQKGSGTLSARVGSAWRGLEHALSGTPGRLRIVSAVSVLAAVLIALGGGAALRERSAAIDAAQRSAAHLVLVQSVQVHLAQANADATNSLLGFGRIEPQAQRLDYINSIQAASRDLALAAQGSTDDAAVLGAANAQLSRYTGYIASARANNLEALPVGANYLSTANDLLSKPPATDGIFDKLQARADADRKKIDDAYSRAGHAALWLALVAVLGLGVLIWSQLYLTRHSRRILNLPMAAATVAVLVALIVAGAAMAVAESKAKDVRDGVLDQATNLSLSRVAAFTAKSQESLTLIARGSSTAADTDWNASMATAKSKLPSGNDDARKALNDYAAEHQKINKRSVGGDWKGAVSQAITSGDGSANALFGIYDTESQKALDERGLATSVGLADAGNVLLPAGILIVLLGLLAAAGAWWGVTLRLDEYR